MGELKRFKKRPEKAVTAIRLDLETDGFTYRKWGGEQRCKAGDWVVNNEGDVYTVDGESFAATYEPLPDDPGHYRKSAPIWAERAESDGVVETKEGTTEYKSGDYLVYNGPRRSDGYAMGAETFEDMYEEIE